MSNYDLSPVPGSDGAPGLAELHLHLYGCVRPKDLLDDLSRKDRVEWDSYEEDFQAAYGYLPATRWLVERYRAGDREVLAEFERLFVFGDEDAGSFDRFIGKAYLAYAGSLLGSDDASRAEIEAEVLHFAAAVRNDHLRQGVRYAEYRQRIGTGAFESIHDRFAYEVLLAAYDTDTTGLIERLAISLSRTDPWTGWKHVQELALGPHGAALTAVDFCGVEEGHPPKEMTSFLSAVHDFNAAHPNRALAILYHVGESFRDKSLESAVRWVQQAAELGADRLGHAIALGVDPSMFGPHTRQETVAERRDQVEYDIDHCFALQAAGVPVNLASLREELVSLQALSDDAVLPVHYDQARLDEVRQRQDYAMRRVQATGAVIEVCPASNRRIGGIENPAHHPVHRFLAAELPTVVSSDDPGTFGTTLDEELDWVCEQTRGGTELRQKLIETAWNSRSEVLSGRIVR